MSIATQIATAEKWLKYWSDKLSSLRNAFKRTAPPAPNTSAPTAPVLGTATVSTSYITVPVSTASTHADGIAGYQVWRGTSSGAEAYIGNTTVTPYVSPGLAAGTYYFKFKGYPNSNSSNVSAFSNEVSATISGALAADSTAPLASVQPSIESGGSATLASVAVITPPADSTVNSGTQVVSGADYVRWYQDGAHDSSKDSYYPNADTEVLEDIGASKTGTGTDNGSTLTSVDVPNGTEAIYSNADGGFTFKRGATKGKVTLFIHPSTATCSAYYGKPIGLQVRATNDPASAYFVVFLFNSGGAKSIGCEWRDSSGAQASQATAVAYTTVPWLKLVYDPDTSTAVASYSTNSTNGTDGSWTTHTTRSMPGVGKSYLSGKFGANGGTSAYTNYSRTVDTQVRYAFTGSQQVGATTTINIAHDAVDKAGNANSVGTARAFTYDALSAGGGGGTDSRLAIYAIGGFSRYGQDVTANLGLMHRAVVTYDVNSGSSSYTVVEAAAKVINSDFAQVPYLDSSRLSTTGIYNRAVAANMHLTNGDGSIAYFGGSGGDAYGFTYTLNFGAYSTDWSPPKRDANGRDVAQLESAYRFDYWRKGGANGIASDAQPANSNNRGSYKDDFLTNPPFAGLFTPGNTDAAYWMVKGVVAAADAERALYVADGVAAPIVGVNASKWYQNADSVMSIIMPVATGKFDLIVMEHIASVLGGTWAGGTNVIYRLNNYVLPLIRTGGYGLFDSDIDPPGYSDRSRQIRFFSTSCFVLTNCLWAPKVNPETYYRAFADTFVYAKCFDVNTSTGVGKAIGSASKAFSWLGAAVDNPQTTAGANGLYVREFANAYVVVNPPDTGGAKTWTAPVQVKRINCDDDTTMDGTVFAAGSSITIPASDGQYFLKWP